MPTPQSEETPLFQTESTPSLTRYDSAPCHRPGSSHRECEHGTTSPHAISPQASPPTSPSLRPFGSALARLSSGRSHNSFSYGTAASKSPDSRRKSQYDQPTDEVPGIGLQTAASGVGNANGGISGKNDQLSTTQYLARRHGVTGQKKMYLSYYFPFLNWISQYKLAYLQGDAIAALTMASFYIPMALSYAENLGHIPPINGLYSFVFNPFIYGLLGTCPRMVVGPEAAGSLLVGTVVKTSVDHGSHADEDSDMNARVAGVVTGMAGAVIFIAGLTRLGFLDSVLSKPFLRGFISAIGFVIMVDQLIPELGLSRVMTHQHGISHASSATKVKFLLENIRLTHGPTAAVAFGSFAIIMVCR